MHPMARLAAVDEANLVLDHVDQVNVFLVAGLLAPGGFVAADGTPDMAGLRGSLRERVAALPALCRSVTRRGGRHSWVSTAPDLEHHIRLVAPVDGLAGLQRTCAALMIQPLELDRPLWEILVVPGATASGPGVVLRVHHALADGMAAVAIVQRLFDSDGRVEDPGDGVGSEPTAPTHRDLRHTLRQLAVRLQRIRGTLQTGAVAPTMLLGAREPNRGVAFLRTDLRTLERRVRPRGATVNDALLAGVAAGLRAALSAAGEPTPARLPVSVPVALRRRGTAGNHVGVMLVQLPTGEPDPDERLRLISTQTREEKARARAQGTLEFMRGPIGARIMDRVARRQHLVAGFVTNVPGPTTARRLAGAPVTAIWPVAVLAGNVRLGVAAVSYDGQLCCGIHFDATNVPGDAFTHAMGEEMARLGE